MRIYKQISKDGKTVFTISLWGEDGHEADMQEALREIIRELERPN